MSKDDVVKVTWRIPLGLLKQIETEAREHDRSANAEARQRLSRSFGPTPVVSTVVSTPAPWALERTSSTAQQMREIQALARSVSTPITPQAGPRPILDGYEGKYPIGVLLLRTEPEDFGPRIELWRALRDVSRNWLCDQTGIPRAQLRAWETGNVMIPEKTQPEILALLAEMDERYPELAEKAVRNEALAREQDRANAERARNPEISGKKLVKQSELSAIPVGSGMGAYILSWRNLREVGRPELSIWLSDLGIQGDMENGEVSTTLLNKWERGDVPVPAGVRKALVEIDRQHPDLRQVGQASVPRLANDDPGNVNEEVEWLPGSLDYQEQRPADDDLWQVKRAAGHDFKPNSQVPTLCVAVVGQKEVDSYSEGSDVVCGLEEKWHSVLAGTDVSVTVHPKTGAALHEMLAITASIPKRRRKANWPNSATVDKS